MPLFGSHLSIAGGYHLAVLRAAELGMDCVQLFTKNNNQWRAKPMTEEDARLFKQSLTKTGITHPIAHDSYLINLAASDEELWNKSVDAMVVELERAHLLGITHVVAHPGSHVGAGEEFGLRRVAEGLDRVFERTAKLTTTVALETTAGQGTNLGHRFEHLAAIIQQCSYPDRLTACLDTCHVFAAGYPLAPKKKYLETFAEFDRVVGLDRLVAFHVNDSKKGLGSRVDRHEHIGKGCLGIEPFEHLVNDRRFAKLPMYLETAKETDPETGKDWDEINLEVLRGLIKRPSRKPKKASS
ncbi:MAG: deoxyribonuclease IV [Planctomycetota bacterium]